MISPNEQLRRRRQLRRQIREIVAVRRGGFWALERAARGVDTSVHNMVDGAGHQVTTH